MFLAKGAAFLVAKASNSITDAGNGTRWDKAIKQLFLDLNYF